MVRGRNLLLTLAFVASACAQGSPPSAPDTPTAPATAPPAGGLPQALATPGGTARMPDPRMLEPLTALGPCSSPPGAPPVPPVEGLVLPDEAIVQHVSDTGPITNVTGYMTMTPVQARVFYEQHGKLEVVSVEDEVRESEVLIELAGRRLFVKTQAVCELGSVFVAVIAPAGQ